MIKTSIGVELEEVRCPACGIVFWVDCRYKEHRLEDHKMIYCPNGHGLYYPEETEAEQLRRKLHAANQQLQSVKKQRDDLLDQKVRLEKRIKVGICPYCHRHFANLERHIHTKHKDKS